MRIKSYPIKTHAVPLRQIRLVMALKCVGQVHGLWVVGVHGSRAGPNLVHVSWHTCHTLHQSGVACKRH